MIRKIFSLEKQISAPTANKLGLQVCRMLVARWSRKLRRRVRFQGGNEIRSLETKGWCAFEDFLPQEQFNELLNELDNALKQCPREDECRPDCFGHIRQTIGIRLDDQETYPTAIGKVVLEQRVVGVFSGFEARKQERLIHDGLHKVRFERAMKVAEGNVQPRTASSAAILHVDSFNSVLKGFLYLNDVNSKNGALRYVEGSNRLYWNRLRDEYRSSVGREGKEGVSRVKEDAYGARRVTDEASQRHGRILNMEYPQNSLVIVDVSGLHSRGDFCRPGMHRDILYFEYRTNPFW